MRILSRIELARCNRAQLQSMLHAITMQLPFLPDGSPELQAAHANLRAIRNVLMRPTLTTR